ncbi:MAG: metallophosphoesterase [Actinobacteria bacterium]|nr:metallophosphoesterase [Actinomycetota bacterium]MCG2820022.1 metallophosphoesterase [Actinomycetes bacterium]MBU4219856.1 metallophosphoesterase [Actinomycetota bacterium]MBU4358839.1 metallophosphoesterase [Actinomycetota bacterium]MBU4401112.1 metallophosphoesterase [Actinomycetota bacterium]
MKFIHTADWQIGMKAAHVGEAGSRVREKRLEAARNVVEAAKEFGADFILVAGDTFEDNGVDPINIQKVADILGSFDGPVYIIPGNHDPFVPGSVWGHSSWKSHDNVHVLTEAEPMQITGGWLFPCPVLEKYSLKDPTAWIDTSGKDGIMVGMAHGNVEGLQLEEPDYPIPRDAAAHLGLDYLALGHWHSFGSFPGTDGADRMVYSGTHESTGFGERDSGNVTLVEISEEGQAPSVTPERTGVLEWIDMRKEIMGEGDLDLVRKEIESVGEPSNCLVRLTLSGLLPLSEDERLTDIKGVIASRFLFGQVNDLELYAAADDEEALEEIPDGIMREAGGVLIELADPGYSGERPDGASPEVALMAFRELYAIARKQTDGGEQ